MHEESHKYKPSPDKTFQFSPDLVLYRHRSSQAILAGEQWVRSVDCIIVAVVMIFNSVILFWAVSRVRFTRYQVGRWIHAVRLANVWITVPIAYLKDAVSEIDQRCSVYITNYQRPWSMCASPDPKGVARFLRKVGMKEGRRALCEIWIYSNRIASRILLFTCSGERVPCFS